MPKATLLLQTLKCVHSSPEVDSDDVFVRVYVDDDLKYRWPDNNNTVDFDKNQTTSVDMALNVDYSSHVKIEVWDRDAKGNDDSIDAPNRHIPSGGIQE